MSVEENKATLQRAAEAFNNPRDRSSWFDIHDSSVVARGLGPLSPTISSPLFMQISLFSNRNLNANARATGVDSLSAMPL